MSFRFPIKNLYVLPDNYPFYIGEDSNKEEQPKEIKIQLKDHQLTSYNHIKSLEDNDGFYFINDNKVKNVIKIKDYNKYLENLYENNNTNHTINHFSSNYWILSDKTGYGKTLTALCCLRDKDKYLNKITNLNQLDKSKENKQENFSCPYNISSKSGLNYSSFKISFTNNTNEKENDMYFINTTLIIVPHGKVFTQWCSTIDNYTNYEGIQIKNVNKILEEKLKVSTLKNLIERVSETFNPFIISNYQVLSNNIPLFLNKFIKFEEKLFEDFFKEFMDYKNYFNNLDYIMIVNTFARPLLKIFNKFFLAFKLFNSMYLLYKCLKDILDYCNNKKEDLENNLFKNNVSRYGYSNVINLKTRVLKMFKNDDCKKLFSSNDTTFVKSILIIMNDNIWWDNSAIEREDLLFSNDYNTTKFQFYRIIIDEADSINLKGAYNIYLDKRYKKLGLITATYTKLISNSAKSHNLFDNLIIYSRSSQNTYFPIILNDDDYLEKSFSMPVINRKYLICDYNEQLSHFMHNSNYLINRGLISSEVKELLNVNDFNGALKKMGATENSNDNIIDIICKDVIRNLKNKKIERDMIDKLDLEQNIKNARLQNIDKNIKELEEKLDDINSKFQDINIYDKIASTFTEEMLEDIDEYYNTIDTLNLPNNYLEKIRDIFNNHNIDIDKNQDNINLFEKIVSLVKNPNKFCGVCSSVYRNPVLLDCTHIFCSSCISMLLKSNTNNNCPLCRKAINFKKLCLITNEIKQESVKEQKKIVEITNLNTIFELIKKTTDDITFEDDSLNGNDDQIVSPSMTKNEVCKTVENKDFKYIEIYKTKMDKIESIKNLLNYIQNTNPKKKVLVYSNHELIVNNIKEEIQNNSLKYITENMVGKSAEGCINRFKNKDSNLLFLNANRNAAGIELPEGTDIIIVHRMEKEIETQIIGRCMRMGRKEPLNVYYLYHKNEN
jgi:hypothetical protein